MRFIPVVHVVAALVLATVTAPVADKEVSLVGAREDQDSDVFQTADISNGSFGISEEAMPQQPDPGCHMSVYMGGNITYMGATDNGKATEHIATTWCFRILWMEDIPPSVPEFHFCGTGNYFDVHESLERVAMNAGAPGLTKMD
ncbi:hypothetical protein B0H19DRAFT_1083239 [Mycena capillaripes]|nr:hypothetical protein B0H19DRAFT_1083239 [Mycena capillaripes]